jgi:hypothetical protein
MELYYGLSAVVWVLGAVGVHVFLSDATREIAEETYGYRLPCKDNLVKLPAKPLVSASGGTTISTNVDGKKFRDAVAALTNETSKLTGKGAELHAHITSCLGSECSVEQITGLFARLVPAVKHMPDDTAAQQFDLLTEVKRASLPESYEYKMAYELQEYMKTTRMSKTTHAFGTVVFNPHMVVFIANMALMAVVNYLTRDQMAELNVSPALVLAVQTLGAILSAIGAKYMMESDPGYVEAKREFYNELSPYKGGASISSIAVAAVVIVMLLLLLIACICVSKKRRPLSCHQHVPYSSYPLA